MIEWTEHDHHLARRERWSVYAPNGSLAWLHPGRTDVAIECAEYVDDMNRRDEDAKMVEHVARRADEGSELHVKALAYVAQQRLLA